MVLVAREVESARVNYREDAEAFEEVLLGRPEVAGKPSHGMIEALHGTLNSCVCLLLQSTHIAAQTMRKSNAVPLALGFRNWRLWTSGARSAHPCPCQASLLYTRDTTLLPISLAAARTRPSTAGRSIAPTPSFGRDSRRRDSKELERSRVNSRSRRASGRCGLH